MNVGNIPVLKLSMDNNNSAFKLGWMKESWKDSKELNEDAAFQGPVDKANGVLKTAHQLKAKGVGKGKPHS